MRLNLQISDQIKVYVFGGAISTTPLSNNGFAEEIDTKTGEIGNVSEYLSVYGSSGGLASSTCMISMPDENSFAMTGGIISDIYQQ